jgi:hypothetical protein
MRTVPFSPLCGPPGTLETGTVDELRNVFRRGLVCVCDDTDELRSSDADPTGRRRTP